MQTKNYQFFQNVKKTQTKDQVKYKVSQNPGKNCHYGSYGEPQALETGVHFVIKETGVDICLVFSHFWVRSNSFVIHPTKRPSDILPLVQPFVQIILFQVVNASSNILIYLFVGHSFRAKVKKILGMENFQSSENCFFVSFIRLFRAFRYYDTSDANSFLLSQIFIYKDLEREVPSPSLELVSI